MNRNKSSHADWASLRPAGPPKPGPVQVLKTTTDASASDLLPILWLGLVCATLVVLLLSGVLQVTL